MIEGKVLGSRDILFAHIFTKYIEHDFKPVLIDEIASEMSALSIKEEDIDNIGNLKLTNGQIVVVDCDRVFHGLEKLREYIDQDTILNGHKIILDMIKTVETRTNSETDIRKIIEDNKLTFEKQIANLILVGKLTLRGRSISTKVSTQIVEMIERNEQSVLHRSKEELDKVLKN